MSIAALTNTALQEAIGPPGAEGNAEKIAYVAHRLGDSYSSFLEWSHDFARVSTPELYTRLVSIVAQVPANAIRELEEFSAHLHDELLAALMRPPSAYKKVPINIAVTFTLPDNWLEAFARELMRIKQRLEEGIS